MREFLLSHKVVSIALPLLGVVAVIIGELVSPTGAYIIVGIIAVWLICAIIYWWKNRKRTSGGLEIKANTVNIINNFIFEVKSEDTRGGGLPEKGESTEIVDSSTDAKKE